MSQQPSTNNDLRNVLSDSLAELFTILLFGSMPTQKTFPEGQEQTEEFVPRFRFSAYYNVFGDGEGTYYVRNILQHAVEADHIVDYDVLLGLTGYMGMQTVTFTFDVDMPGETGFAGVIEKAEMLMNDIIGDSDVEVYGVTVLNAPGDTTGDEPEEESLAEWEPLAEWERELLEGDDYRTPEQRASDEALAALREKLTGETREQTERRLAAAASQDAWDTEPEPLAVLREKLAGEACEQRPVNTFAEPTPFVDAVEVPEVLPLCYDDWTGRYFRGTMASLEVAMHRFNSIVMEEGSVELNTFYDLIELAPIPMGVDFGWSEPMSLIFGSILSPQGEPAIAISFRNAPKPNLGQYR